MSTVFYRKWRPTRFSDVVGQQHVTETLRRAVQTDRVAHAYLFTGPRGVGKTSTARILAKALNAELDENGDPKSDTETAIAIDEGRYMDLIEIDGASNRSVNDVRDLRERVLLRPSIGDYKVYIIDEVHMLTTEAFNALLKTLEEPPPQVVMILATTDIHRVPATIISRCQRFDFRRLSSDDVISRLVLICDEEGIECEPSVLELVARAAWGSLRDAENLLEQLAVSYGDGNEITEDQARELLGIGDESTARELASAVLRKDAKRALEIVEEEAARGTELRGLRDGTIAALRGALLKKHGVEASFGDQVDTTELEADAMSASSEQILHAITAFGRNERFADASSPLTLEVAVVKAIAGPPAVNVVAPRTARQATPSGARQPQPSGASRAPRGRSGQASTASPRGDDNRWSRFLEGVDLALGSDAKAVFAAMVVTGPADGRLTLRPRDSAVDDKFRAIWGDDANRAKLRPHFQDVYGSSTRLQLMSATTQAGVDATSTANENPGVTPATHSDASDADGAERSGSIVVPEEVDSDPLVQRLRNVGGRVVSVEDVADSD